MYLLISAPDSDTAKEIWKRIEKTSKFEKALLDDTGGREIDLIQVDKNREISGFLNAYDPDQQSSPLSEWIRIHRPDVERFETLVLDRKDCLLSKGRVVVASENELSRWARGDKHDQLKLILGGSGNREGTQQ